MIATGVTVGTVGHCRALGALSGCRAVGACGQSQRLSHMTIRRCRALPIPTPYFANPYCDSPLVSPHNDCPLITSQSHRSPIPPVRLSTHLHHCLICDSPPPTVMLPSPHPPLQLSTVSPTSLPIPSVTPHSTVPTVLSHYVLPIFSYSTHFTLHTLSPHSLQATLPLHNPHSSPSPRRIPTPHSPLS